MYRHSAPGAARARLDRFNKWPEAASPLVPARGPLQRYRHSAVKRLAYCDDFFPSTVIFMRTSVLVMLMMSHGDIAADSTISFIFVHEKQLIELH